MWIGKNDIILDFFAGSATTAHAVMKLNAEDGGNRRFIMVQLPEACGEKKEAYKAGYKTIAEIGKERIRRAGQAICQDTCHPDWQGDIGFRVLKIDSPNLRNVHRRPDETPQSGLLDRVDNIVSGRTPEDLLFGVLVAWGVDLTLPIVSETIENKRVFFVDSTDLAACFDIDLSEDLITAIALRKPLRAVFRDSGLTTDSDKINAEKIFKQISPSTDLRVI